MREWGRGVHSLITKVIDYAIDDEYTTCLW